MRVPQSRQPGPFERQLRVAALIPDLSPRRAVHAIALQRLFGVQPRERLAKTPAIRGHYEVVVIGEDRPSLKTAIVLPTQGEQPRLQPIKPRPIPVEVLLQVRRARNEEHALPNSKPMQRRMRPIHHRPDCPSEEILHQTWINFRAKRFGVRWRSHRFRFLLPQIHPEAIYAQ
jgi:hypothetical protein